MKSWQFGGLKLISFVLEPLLGVMVFVFVFYAFK